MKHWLILLLFISLCACGMKHIPTWYDEDYKLARKLLRMNMKFNFQDFNGIKKADLKLTKNDGEDTYNVIVMCDGKDCIQFLTVPSQYIKEDQIDDKEKTELSEEDSTKLVKHRVNIVLSQLRQCIFTANLYGAKIDGFIEPIKKDEK